MLVVIRLSLPSGPDRCAWCNVLCKRGGDCAYVNYTNTKPVTDLRITGFKVGVPTGIRTPVSTDAIFRE